MREVRGMVEFCLLEQKLAFRRFGSSYHFSKILKKIFLIGK